MNSTKKLFLSGLIFLFIGCSSSETTTIKSDNIGDNISINTPAPTPTNAINNAQIETQRAQIEENENESNSTIIADSISQEREESREVITETEQNLNRADNIELYPTPRVTTPPTTDTLIAEDSTSSDDFLKNCSQIVDKEFFEVCYSYDLKVAKAVIYRLEGDLVNGDLVNELNIQERPNFYEEEQIPQEYRAEYSDYTNSGYDRGHLAPDASFDWSIESLEATYSLANIIPQVPEINRYGWADLEQYVRDQAVELGYVDVINVVEYKDSPERIGENQIAVSSGYYKILSNEDENYKECFYYKNEEPQEDSGDVESHRVDCNIIR